jgi:hypothetical protein
LSSLFSLIKADTIRKYRRDKCGRVAMFVGGVEVVVVGVGLISVDAVGIGDGASLSNFDGPDIGSAVAKGTGTAVGVGFRMDGARIGEGEGFAVDALVGAFVGASVVASVGALVGDLFADLFGAVVGDVVGDVVGALVRALVGSLVGALVDALVGDLVGALVGDLVGDVVTGFALVPPCGK